MESLKELVKSRNLKVKEGWGSATKARGKNRAASIHFCLPTPVCTAWMVFVVESRAGVSWENTASKLGFAFCPGNYPGWYWISAHKSQSRGFPLRFKLWTDSSWKTFLNANEESGTENQNRVLIRVYDVQVSWPGSSGVRWGGTLMCKVVIFKASAIWSQSLLVRVLPIPFLLTKVFEPWLAIRNDNNTYKKSPYIWCRMPHWTTQCHIHYRVWSLKQFSELEKLLQPELRPVLEGPLVAGTHWECSYSRM